MNWIDIILLVILLLFIVIGFWKGFIFSIISIFSTLINFIIALFLTRPATNLLNSWFGLENTLTNSFANKLSSMHEGFTVNLLNFTSDADISSHISNTLSESNFPLQKLIKSMLNVSKENIANKDTLTLSDILSKSFGSFFSLIISFVIIFILIYIVLFIISKISKKAKENDGIRIIDRILGVLFGILKGSLVIITLFTILSFFKEDGLLKPLFEYIKTSEVSNWIYSNINLLVDKYITLDNIKNIITT